MPTVTNRLAFVFGRLFKRHPLVTLGALCVIGGSWVALMMADKPGAARPAVAQRATGLTELAEQTAAPQETRRPQPPSWLDEVGRIVGKPKENQALKTDVNPKNHAVSYAFRVAGLSQLLLNVYDDKPTRWELTIAATDLDVSMLALNSATVICRHPSFPTETVWYRLDAGPLRTAYAVRQAPSGKADPTVVVTSLDEMRAQMTREQATGLLPPAPSVDEYIRASCR